MTAAEYRARSIAAAKYRQQQDAELAAFIRKTYRDNINYDTGALDIKACAEAITAETEAMIGRLAARDAELLEEYAD